MSKPQHSKPVRLAHAALQTAVEQRWQTATDLMDRINRECPGEGLGDALIAWCDAMQDHATDGDMSFQRIRTKPMAIETGELIAHDGKAAYLDWCVRLIQARAAGDRDAFADALDELNAVEGGKERGRYVSMLVESIGLSIRSLPRGYAALPTSPREA